jgi:hypothetical protein
MFVKVKIPATTKRVERHTCKKTNNKINQNTVNTVNKYTEANVEDLTQRLEELDNEWDTERVLEANAATLVLTSSLLGAIKFSKWFIVTGVVGFFLLLHSLVGWCPPLPIIRKMGIRTSDEINNESIIIRFLRGDFSKTSKQYPNDLLHILK